MTLAHCSSTDFGTDLDLAWPLKQVEGTVFRKTVLLGAGSTSFRH